MLTGGSAAVSPPATERRESCASAPAFDCAELFAGLDKAEALLLAVSGGPDSMALMLLASRWADTLANAPALHVATIDHGLRPEAADETALVAETAASLGLPCAILPWLGPKPSTRIQERARAARYDLLVGLAREIGACAILTAHHADDQAETVLLRLTRGSGLGGLAGMRRETKLAQGIALIRPLLGVPKSDLVALCRSEGQRTVDDPSNHDPAYARARLRSQAAALQTLGLDRPALLRLARRMARADAALDAEADRLEQSLAPTCEHARYGVVLAASLKPELLLRLVRRAILHVAGPDAVIRLDRLETLTDALQSALRERRPYRATLSGLRITLGRDTMLDVMPEPPRRRGRPQPEGKCRD